MAQRHAHTGHIQKIQCGGNILVQLLKGFQASLGQQFCFFTGQRVQAVLFCLQFPRPLL